jgi:hypothetical protein
LGIDILWIHGTAAQVPAVPQVRIGRTQVQIDRRLAGQRRLPCGVEFVHVVVRRLEPVFCRGAQRTHQAFGLATRALAVAPHQLVAVSLVEPLFFEPEMMGTFVVVRGKRRVLRGDGAPQRGADVGVGRVRGRAAPGNGEDDDDR